MYAFYFSGSTESVPSPLASEILFLEINIKQLEPLWLCRLVDCLFSFGFRVVEFFRIVRTAHLLRWGCNRLQIAVNIFRS